MEKETSIEDIFKEYKQVERKTRGLFGTPLFRRSRAVKSFSQSHPEYILYLGNQFKSVAGPVERATTYSKISKVEKVLRDYEISKEPSRIKRFVKRHPAVLPAVVGAQALISAMSPEHPLMVDAYLADNFKDLINDTVTGKKLIEKEELNSFMTSITQFNRYEDELKMAAEKAVEERPEKGFIVVRHNGKLEQRNLRNIFESLSTQFPDDIRLFLSNTSIYRLDDVVDIWMQGDKKVANGHYHPFGEAPSRIDLTMSQFTRGSDIVISNGLIPLVFIDGSLMPIKEEIKLDKETSKILDYNPPKFFSPIGISDFQYVQIDNGDYNNYFLGFFKRRYGSDSLKIDEMTSIIGKKFMEFERDYFRLYNQYLSDHNRDIDSFADNFKIFFDTQKGLALWAKDPTKRRLSNGIVIITEETPLEFRTNY